MCYKFKLIYKISWLVSTHSQTTCKYNQQRISVFLGRQVTIESIVSKCLLIFSDSKINPKLTFNTKGRLINAWQHNHQDLTMIIDPDNVLSWCPSNEFVFVTGFDSIIKFWDTRVWVCLITHTFIYHLTMLL